MCCCDTWSHQLGSVSEHDNISFVAWILQSPHINSVCVQFKLQHLGLRDSTLKLLTAASICCDVSAQSLQKQLMLCSSVVHLTATIHSAHQLFFIECM